MLLTKADQQSKTLESLVKMRLAAFPPPTDNQNEHM